MTRLVLMAGALAAAGLALSACNRTATDDKVFGERVRAYLLAHPEVLQEAAQKLQDNQEAKEEAVWRDALAKGQRALPAQRAALEHDPADYVVNPTGRITVTEFYDYRCPHCSNVAPKVAAFLAANKDVRFVFKEMPIFGPTSEHAARAALAVKADGGDYLGLYQAYMATRALNDDAIDQLAQAHGAKTVTLISPQATRTANDHLAANTRLYNALFLRGTPAFIIGDVIVPGENMDAVITAVNQERMKARS